MLPKAVTDYLDAHHKDHLEKFFELLRIPSIANAPDDACEQAAEWVARAMRDAGLTAEVVELPGGRPNVIGRLHVADDAPTVLIYGHYDVQPPDPLKLWDSPPFEPTVRDGAVYARGSSDDKGQVFAHLRAIEAWQRAGGGMPVNVVFFVEGEEEVGSPHLEPFIADQAEALAADCAVVSDTGFFTKEIPCLTYGMRGICYLEIRLTGPSRDIHSGLHGGLIANPANAVAKLVAALHDDDGRITIPGFYDDVRPLSDTERSAWEQLPFDEDAYAAEMGVAELGAGEKGLPALERRWARPTLDCNGIVSGYGGAGPKTIIPSTATAKITMRLVPDQDPAKIAAACKTFVQKHIPPGITAEVFTQGVVRPFIVPTDSPAMRAAAAAVREGFGAEPALIRNGASVPITELFQRILGLDAVVMGMGLPDDNLHSPNEHFGLEQLWRGSVAAAAFYKNLAEQ